MGPHRRLLFNGPGGRDKQPAELLDGKGICHASDVVADRTVYALLQADLLKVGGEGVRVAAVVVEQAAADGMLTVTSDEQALS